MSGKDEVYLVPIVGSFGNWVGEVLWKSRFTFYKELKVPGDIYLRGKRAGGGSSAGLDKDA